MMHHHTVHELLCEVEQELLSRLEVQHRRAWQDSKPRRRLRPATVVEWLGDALIAAGERLRSWSRAGATVPES